MQHAPTYCLASPSNSDFLTGDLSDANGRAACDEHSDPYIGRCSNSHADSHVNSYAGKYSKSGANTYPRPHTGRYTRSQPNTSFTLLGLGDS